MTKMIQAARTSGYQSGLRDGYQRALADITHDAAERADMAAVKPIVSRTGPEWKAAMAASGTKIGVAMGLYMDGDITVDGKYAVTKLRVPVCKRCRESGRKECRVVDPPREVNLASRMCGYCLRSAKGCVD